jgi:hypothetical protein
MKFLVLLLLLVFLPLHLPIHQASGHVKQQIVVASFSTKQQVAQKVAFTEYQNSNATGVLCNGVYWDEALNATYSPSYCYGHDEAALDFFSTTPGSGSNAVFRIVLPNSTHKMPFGFLASTFWIGGVVYDPRALNSQALLEFQFYPSAPKLIGAGSGSQDCTSGGAKGRFEVIGSPETNLWFACAYIFELVNQGGNLIEDIPFHASLDVSGSSDSIMVMNSGDFLSVNLSGSAQSSAQGWRIDVTDFSTHQRGSLVLQNSTVAFPPYYDKALLSYHLAYAAAYLSAISFAFELGHSVQYLNSSYQLFTDCYTYNFSDGGYGGVPGDGKCYSYWPGAWAESGLPKIFLPVMGVPGNYSYPNEIGFSSSAGGEKEVVESGYCPSPSFSNTTNCIYPFYVYSARYHSFSMQSSIVSWDTFDYGNMNQFPVQIIPSGQYNLSVYKAPWGTLSVNLPYRLNYSMAIEFDNFVFSYSFNQRQIDVELPVGSYTVNITTNGCESFVKEVNITMDGNQSLSPSINCLPPVISAFEAKNFVTDMGLQTYLPFEVNVTRGVPPFNYSLFVDGKLLTSSISSMHYYISNFDTHTLSVGNHTYYVQVSDFLGRSVKSKNVELVVNPDPKLKLVSSTNQTDINLQLNLSVFVSQGSPPYTYSWHLNGESVSSAQSFVFHPTQRGSFRFVVRVTDSAGYVITRSINVTVNTDPIITSFITKPSSSSVFYTNNIIFASVNVTQGTTPYHYQWLLNGRVIANTSEPFYSFRLNQTGNYKISVNVLDSAGYTLESSPIEVSFRYNYFAILLVALPSLILLVFLLRYKRRPPPPPPDLPTSFQYAD